MSKIVFVNPPVSLEERYGKLSSLGSTFPNYGLLLLASVVREKGYETAIIEASSLGLSQAETVNEIINNKPDYVGITATTLSIFHAAKLAKALKKKMPDFVFII